MTMPKLHLPEVTLVAVTSIAMPATARALSLCLEQIEFGEALLLSDQPLPALLNGRVKRRAIDPIRSRRDYSRFMMGDLYRHIGTSHALCVQWDGYVLDSQAWNPAFLTYDYIGAPWPHFADAHAVGNGGFSLRSRRLLAACATLPPPVELAEDVAICRQHRSWLESEFALRFAPRDLAADFAFERSAPEGATFGFHGVFNLIRMGGADAAADLIAGLEPRIMAPNELREVLWWALGQRRWTLACKLLGRLLQR